MATTKKTTKKTTPKKTGPAKVVENILSGTLDELIGEKFGNYSKYIIQERALPDLRDGLKPVQRRVLYAMQDLRLTHKSPYKKSARVVGDVIGKYHPHGDTSVYDAMVRLAQEWKVNMPLVDMHGNKGSVDGDSPAAMRYTETRLGKISSQLLLDIDKDLVSFSPNFDDSELEPTVLPARYPNLLVNGATGIASGYSTNIPPHNLKELIKALIYIFKNESVTLSNLTRYIKGPDFPTGGSVSSSKSIKEAYRSGKGKVVITSTWEYNEKAKQIEITEIPYEVNKSDLVKKIDDLIRNNKVPGIKEVRDDTDRKGLQITLLCKPEVNVELVMNYLFKSTDLRKNYSFNMVAIKDKKPELLGLLDILQSFADFQIEIYTKLYKFELLKLEKRLEIVEGLIKVVDIIDKIIDSIRKSKNKKEAREGIMKKFDFTENQAEAIVTLRLYRLSSTDVNELEEELKLLKKTITHFKKGIKDKSYLKQNIITELENISKEYGVERKSTIEEEIEEVKIDEKDLIQEEIVWVSVTHQGYIKKISQRSKEAADESTFGKREDDIIISMTETSNLLNLVFFSAQGRYFSLPIYKLSDSKFKDIGEHVSKFTSLDALDRIVATAIVGDFNRKGELVFSTKNGMIKRSLIKDMTVSSNKRGAKYMGVKDGDEVVSVSMLTDKQSFVTSITEKGYGVRYVADNLSTTGLSAAGVKNVNVTDGDKVVATMINPIKEVDKGESQVIIVTHNGKAKRIRTNDVKALSRASKGALVASQTKSNPYRVINAFNVDITDNIYILTDGDENINLRPKGDLTITESSTGLTQLVKKAGIKLSFNDLTLPLDELVDYSKTQETKLEIKATQLELDDLLDDF